MPELQRNGVTLVLADVDDDVRKQLDAYGLIERIGEDRIFASFRDAIDAYGRLPAGDAAAGDAADGAPPSVEAAAVEDPAPMQDADGDQHPEGG